MNALSNRFAMEQKQQHFSVGYVILTFVALLSILFDAGVKTRAAADDLKTFIAECGYHCRGEVLNMKTTKEAR